MKNFEVILAKPRGFCAGVDRAIEIVKRALEMIGPPIYVRHEVVHNKYVVDSLRERGAIFVDDIDTIPPGSSVIYSAHGVSQDVRKQAKTRDLKVLDATCPLVTKVHVEVARCSRNNMECVLIGHAGHPEVEGTLGQYDNPDKAIYLVENKQDVAALAIQDPEHVVYVTQTTLSVDDTNEIISALKARFPLIQGPSKEDICYATQNRQDAIKEIAGLCEVIIVVGSPTSSNSNRLRELAERLGCEAYLVDGAHEVNAAWLEGKKTVGVSAGASAPELLVQQVVTQLKTWGGSVREWAGKEENIVFALPKELRDS